jgi:hypothetical protein
MTTTAGSMIEIGFETFFMGNSSEKISTLLLQVVGQLKKSLSSFGESIDPRTELSRFEKLQIFFGSDYPHCSMTCSTYRTILSPALRSLPEPFSVEWHFQTSSIHEANRILLSVELSSQISALIAFLRRTRGSMAAPQSDQEGEIL